jgi:hypothetical protein
MRVDTVDDHLLEVAWTRACDGLGVARGTALGAREASVLLKYVVAEWASVPGASPASATCRGRQAWREWISGGATALDQALLPEAVPVVQRLLQADETYACRIIDLAVADLVSEPMAPEVCIEPEPVADLPDDVASWNHAVVFAAAPLITHELYPLTADACVHDAHAGGPFFRVLGVHGDWLTDGCARRVLMLDPTRDRFTEMALATPVPLHSAQLMALGSRQTERHLCWSNQLSCPLVNAGPASARADDKHDTATRWRTAGLEVPEGGLMHPGDRGVAHEFLDRHETIVVKPNEGTEGERVLFLAADTAHAREQLDAQLSACWEWGPARLEKRRDGLAWLDPDSRRVRSLAIRLHVAADGDGTYRAESGYALVGEDIDTPAARGRGGILVALQSVLSSLVRRDDGEGVGFSHADLERAQRLAERAATSTEGLGLSGVDLVLDVSPSGQVVPVLLELNPRPAGLAHARFLPGCGEGRAEAGVSLAMWSGLAAMAEMAGG